MNPFLSLLRLVYLLPSFQENKLIDEIKLLETDEEYIEKIAREEFYMAAPGEIIYRVKRDKVLD